MIHESCTLVCVPHQSGIPAIDCALNVYYYYWVCRRGRDERDIGWTQSGNRKRDRSRAGEVDWQ